MTNLIAALNPVALSFGGLEIRWYGVIIAAGILVAMALATKEAEKKGLGPDFIVDMMFWTIPIGIIGARITMYCLNWIIICRTQAKSFKSGMVASPFTVR